MSSSPFSHSAFYQGTKKVAPLKIRNPSIHPSQIMPTPSGVPFNVSDMPWSFNGNRTPGQLMEFNAVIRPSPLSQSPPFGKFQPALSPVAMCELRKRKTELEPMPVPPKQFLTEEAMASHLNNMHLSTEYTSHGGSTEDPGALGSTNSGGLSPCSSLDDDMSLGEPGPGSTAAAAAAAARHVYMSPQELEDRLRKAQRIAVCEEVRKLDNRAEILPKVLLERIEKPCTALVLWQPPATPLELATKLGTAQEQKEEAERRTSEEMMGEDEPLPDLPEYDDDLDFEVNNNNNNNNAAVGDFNSMDMEM
ncbi:hypothetical protein pipiens_004995 [Culex pipiens pipiens]|uniref:Uncharacterized protein n=1 Tax=Culex pipiens pipiens TaxID=38569 RepID=A0ABD1CCM7_CULPP